jgi:hypothetical protein
MQPQEGRMTTRKFHIELTDRGWAFTPPLDHALACLLVYGSLNRLAECALARQPYDSYVSLHYGPSLEGDEGGHGGLVPPGHVKVVAPHRSCVLPEVDYLEVLAAWLRCHGQALNADRVRAVSGFEDEQRAAVTPRRPPTKGL